MKSIYLKNNADRGMHGCSLKRAEWKAGNEAVVPFEDEPGRWIAAVKECHVTKPSKFTGSLLHDFYRTRGLPTPKQLDALNRFRKLRGLPVVSIRTSDPKRRAARASVYAAEREQRFQAMQASRPLKPPGAK